MLDGEGLNRLVMLDLSRSTGNETRNALAAAELKTPSDKKRSAIIRLSQENRPLNLYSISFLK
ncbi:MAG: hypothetical protein K2Z81_08330 [Cyanobacteria bacterium]|nr:hypothetical protein [Cyanobacteriota bacterium]